jgi:hypothetical protein
MFANSRERARSWARAKPAALEATLAGTLSLFWVVSLLRVAGALVRREVFGAEATLAVVAVVVVPRLVWTCLGLDRARRNL